MARGATSIFCNAKSVRRQPTFSPLDKSRRVFLFVFLSLIVLSSTCAIFYIGTHIQAVNLGYKISQELQRKEELIEENKRLNLDIARLKSPTRIESEAKDTLGLALPKTQQVYYLSRLDEETLTKISGVASLPGTAKPQVATAAAKGPLPEKTPMLAAKAGQEKSKAALKKVPAPSDKSRETPTTLAKAAPPLPKRAVKEAPQGASDKMPAAIKALAMQAKIPEAKAKVPPNSKPSALEKSALIAAKEPLPKKGVEKNEKIAKPAATLAQKPTTSPKSDLILPKEKPAIPAKASLVAAKEPASQKSMEAKAEKPIKTTTIVAQKPATSPKSDLILPKEKPAAVAQKNDAVKLPAAKSSAKEKPQDIRIAKRGGDEVLVAKIVDKEAPRGNVGAKLLKNGPSLAYQPKEKVPAVMLDPIP